MCTESITNFGSSLIIFQIVFTFAHAQPGLIGLYSIHATVHFVSANIQHVVGDDAFLLHIAQQGIKLFLVLQSSQLVEFSLDGSYTIFVQLHAVHYDFVQVTDFLCHAADFVLGGGKLFNQSLNLLAVVFCKDSKRTVL